MFEITVKKSDSSARRKWPGKIKYGGKIRSQER